MSYLQNEKTYALFDNPANLRLIADIENSGGKIRIFPPVETEKITLDQSTIERLNNLSDFDWLIFADILAVDFFLEILEENNIDFFQLDELRVCALGEAVADRLRFASLHADVIPATVEAKTSFTELANYVGEAGFDTLKLLFPKNISDSNYLVELLREKNATVSELPVYQTKNSNARELTKLKVLLKNGAIDEFIFTSPTDFIALKTYFENEKITGVLSETKVSAIDGATYQTGKENGLETIGLFHCDKIVKVKR
jgi:uroporphyrinogen-III synthase